MFWDKSSVAINADDYIRHMIPLIRNVKQANPLIGVLHHGAPSREIYVFNHIIIVYPPLGIKPIIVHIHNSLTLPILHPRQLTRCNRLGLKQTYGLPNHQI